MCVLFGDTHTVLPERRRDRMVRAAGLWCRSRRKVVSSTLGFAMRRLENSLCQSSSKLVPLSNQGRIRQHEQRDWLRLPSIVPTTSGPPTAIRLWETSTFLYSFAGLIRRTPSPTLQLSTAILIHVSRADFLLDRNICSLKSRIATACVNRDYHIHQAWPEVNKNHAQLS